jgi:nicotinate-nucleotide adenylyltransferase
MPTPRKIALFGGTFDPVHLGHIHLAKLAKDALGLDEIRFLPCQISPHKSSAPTSGADRIAMLRLATTDLPWAIVDDFELQNDPPSFSYLTAEAMAQKFPGSELFWIMGGDQWDALPRWKSPERLAELVQFIVLSRGETPQARAGYRLHVVPGAHPASATEIREKIETDETIASWLDPRVARWAKEHRLYRRPATGQSEQPQPEES